MIIDPKYKRIALIIGFTLAVLLMAWFLYSVFFAPTPPPTITAPPEQLPIGGLPTISEGTGEQTGAIDPVTGLPIG